MLRVVKQPVNRQRKTTAIQLLKQILDEILPVVRGRDYRNLYVPVMSLYKQYVDRVMNQHKDKGLLLTYTYIRNYLHTLNVRHKSNTSICPHCERLYELEQKQCLDSNEKEEVKNLNYHKQVSDSQIVYIREQREYRGYDSVFVVMDFTTIDFVTHHFNDLIITIYFPSFIQYLHFIGEVGVKNDVSFVIYVFENYLISRLNHFANVSIWSDGGPKHFKVSSLSGYLYEKQQQHSHVNFSYNFFGSYHGHSVCDAVAAHAKRKAIATMNETTHVPKCADELCEVVGKLSYTQAFPLSSPSSPFNKYKTFQGIKKYHKFIFSNNVISAFNLSSETNTSTKYDPSKHVIKP